MDPIDPSLTVPCACGCGTMLPPLNKLGKPSRFVKGHGRRGVSHTQETKEKISCTKRTKTDAPVQTIACACGCGTLIPACNRRGEPAQFAHGHNRRNADVKPETRAKLSARTTEQMRRTFGPRRTPGYRHRNYPGYTAWRKEVLRAADYTCQSCGKKLRPCFLHAHHILSWADHPAERLVVSNGLCVCVPCHSKIHGWETGKEPQPCACGCGELCDPRFKFLRGHWTRVRKGEFSRTGMTNSPETRKKISDALTGTVFTPERKANISKAKKGKSIKGHSVSPETKVKMSDARRTYYAQPGNREKMGEAVKAGKAANRPPDGPPVPCECGCGTMLPAKNSVGQPSRFAKGHNRRAQTVSEETRTKMSESAKKRQR